MTDGLLDGLNGIDKPRDVQAREKTALEALCDAAERVLHSDIGRIGVPKSYSEVLSKYYSEVYKDVSAQLYEIQFSDKDIEEFILTKQNTDYSIGESIALGVFTGALAQTLTARSRKHRERSRIYINGQGRRFDYLFFGARNVDEIIVKDLVGNVTCGYIEHASRLVGIGLKGIEHFSNKTKPKSYNSKHKQHKIKEIIIIGNDDNYGIDIENVARVIVVNIGKHTHSALSNVAQTIVVGVDESVQLSIDDVSGYVMTKSEIKTIDKPALDYCALFGQIILKGVEIKQEGSGSVQDNDSSGSMQDINSNIDLQNRSRIMPYNDAAQLIGAEFHKIIYGTSIEEYKQQKRKHFANCFDSNRLARRLRNRSQDEIMRIVDEISRYIDRITQ